MSVRQWAIVLVSATCMSMVSFGRTDAAEAYSADAVKAEFLYRFAGYVEWPGDLAMDLPFTIAVVAEDGVFEQLQHLLPGRTIQNRRVEIRKVSGVSDLEHAQILYVPSHASQVSRALMSAAIGRPILIVTDETGGLAHGGTVNFVQLDRHVRFEISLTAAERSKLKINSGLLSVASYVEGVRPRADAGCWHMFTFSFRSACVPRPALAYNAMGAGRRWRVADRSKEPNS
jgi:hypothetical protein